MPLRPQAPYRTMSGCGQGTKTLEQGESSSQTCPSPRNENDTNVCLIAWAFKQPPATFSLPACSIQQIQTNRNIWYDITPCSCLDWSENGVLYGTPQLVHHSFHHCILTFLLRQTCPWFFIVSWLFPTISHYIPVMANDKCNPLWKCILSIHIYINSSMYIYIYIQICLISSAKIKYIICNRYVIC